MALVVTQVKSSIGTKPKHRGTLRALGLGRVGRVSVLPDRPEIRGMVARVPHLVQVKYEDKSLEEKAAGKVKRPEKKMPDKNVPEKKVGA